MRQGWRSRRLPALGLVFLLSAMLVACGGGSGSGGNSSAGSASSGAQPQASAPKPAAGVTEVIVGVPNAETGPVAAIGEANRIGFDLAANQINASGGIKSLGGAKLKLVYIDHQGKPDLALNAAENLISQQRATVLIGAAVSAATLATTQVAEKYRIPHLVPYVVSNEITERGLKYVFRVGANATQQGIEMARFLEYVAESLKRPLKKVAIVAESGPYGQSVAKVQEQYFTGKGYQVVGNLSYAASDKDLTAVVEKLKALQPDGVVETAYVNDGMLLKKARMQVGFPNIPYVGISSGIGHRSYLTALAQVANGDMTTSLWSPLLTGAESKAVAKLYKDKYGHEADSESVVAYQTVQVLKAALEAAASTDPEKVTAALRQLNLSGADAALPLGVKFDEKGQNKVAHVGFVIQNGSMVPVWPKESATAELTSLVK